MSDNEPAFPLHGIDGPTWEGMTLRDYFAARALPAMIDLTYQAASNGAPINGDYQVMGVAATKAYLAADAMLKARLVQKTEQGDQK